MLLQLCLAFAIGNYVRFLQIFFDTVRMFQLIEIVRISMIDFLWITKSRYIWEKLFITFRIFSIKKGNKVTFADSHFFTLLLRSPFVCF